MASSISCTFFLVRRVRVQPLGIHIWRNDDGTPVMDVAERIVRPSRQNGAAEQPPAGVILTISPARPSEAQALGRETLGL